MDQSSDVSRLSMHTERSGNLYRVSVANLGSEPVKVQEVVLFSLHHDFPKETLLYGEGFTMLSLTCGTLGKPESSSIYPDAQHYRLPQPPGAHTCYGSVLLSPPGRARMLVAFTSCRRFSGKFNLRDNSIEIVVDADGIELSPGERWELEEVMLARGSNRVALLRALATRIAEHHPCSRPKLPVTGWCSYYMQRGEDGIVGIDVTIDQVRTNLDFIRGHLTALRYLQIDEGYQAFDGDWLDTGAAFGGGVQQVLRTIREQGFEPAIWVGPFIAEEKSKLFRDHPDWFIQDDAGRPLRSDRVTFGGWHGPWYALDGTHPKAQEYLEKVFRTMRQEWGCQYFKLDANFWGAMQGGHHYYPKKTRVEAYRLGMDAVRRGAGDGAYILGCNHPIWPSFGLISGSRSSNDIAREWKIFAADSYETLMRNWQNQVLWWNDPDCVLLTGDLPDNEYLFHASAALASGGAILSGDNLPDLPADRLAILRKLLPPSGLAAEFEQDDLSVGYFRGSNESLVFLFNRNDGPRKMSFSADWGSNAFDFWSGTKLGAFPRGKQLAELAGRSAKVIRLIRA